jgi:outer membrane protein assembly factor BamB
MAPRSGLAFSLVLALTAGAGLLADQNWPQFRGTNAGAVLNDPALPDTWSDTNNVAWKTEIPGVGWSSPVVWGEHVFLTAAVNTAGPEPFKAGPLRATDVMTPGAPYRWVVYDIDLASGRIRWQKDVQTTLPPDGKHLKNSYASETPATDGERVYAYFANVGLFAFDMTGRQVWSKDAPKVKYRSGWGSAASPVVHQDRVYLVNDNDTESFVAAYDARSGRELWRTARDEGTNWTTPFVWQNAQRTEIVTAGTKKVRSYDVNGKVLWELSGMSTIAIPTPFASGELLYINSGYVADALRPVYAIRPGASGDISLKPEETSNQFIVWANRTLGSYNPSSLVYNGIYYTLHDRGFVTANDAKTGRELYPRQRLSAEASGFSASPWAYNGKVFALSEDGDTFVFEAGPEFKLVGKNSLAERSLATPAVAGGSLIVRTASKVYRITKH